MRGWGILAVSVVMGAQAPARADSELNANAFENSLVKMTRARDSQMSSLRGDGSQLDRYVVFNYYKTTSQYYLQPQAETLKSSLSDAMDTYLEAVRRNQAQIIAKLPSASTERTAREKFSACLLDNKARLSDMEEAATKAKKALDKLVTFTSATEDNLGDYEKPTYGDVSESVAALSRNPADKFRECCEAQMAGANECVTARDKINEAYSVFAESFNDRVKGVEHYRLPDPTANMRIFEVALILKNRKAKSMVLEARHSTKNSSSENYVFEEIESDCETARRRRQSRSNPAMTRMLLTAAKSLKCDVVPFLGHQYLESTLAHGTFAIAENDYEWEDDRGIRHDLNCDPKIIEAYRQSRTLDPALIAQKWNIDSMRRPQYIQMLASLPATNQMIPIIPLEGGGVFTPDGVIAQPAAPALNSITGGYQVATSGGGFSRGGRVGLASSRAPASISLASIRSSRGLEQGQMLTQGARALSSKIAQGDAPLQNASILKSGATYTRSLARKMVANQAAQGSSQRALARSQSALTANTAYRSLSRAASSRTSARDVLNSIRRGRLNTGNPFGTTTVDDVREENEAERQRLENLALAYRERIINAQQKAEAVRVKILQVIAERDHKISKTMEDILNKTNKDQARGVLELRQDLLADDRALGGLKAEWDIYQNAIFNQQMAIKSLIRFDSTSKPRTSRIQKVDNTAQVLLDFFNPIKLAQAAAKITGKFETEKEWRAAYLSFQTELEKNAELAEKEEQFELKKAVAIYRKRQASITEEKVTDEDTDTLIAMDMYAKAIQEETEDLLEKFRTTRDQTSANGQLLSELRTARDEAVGAQEALETVALQYKDTLPKTVEENPEVWWGMLPQLLIE